jgi:hypothetical protein
MARYFDKFPKILYTKGLEGTNLTTNLLTRIDKIRNELNDSALFYEYSIQEGDTPEIIASKYYNDSELHWIVMIFNDVYDPFYDWPLTYEQFNSFIVNKYTSVELAKTTVHHYEKIVTRTDNRSGVTTSQTYIIDSGSYNTLVPTTTSAVVNNSSVNIQVSKRIVDAYLYEDELNESKRVIKLIKNNLVPEILKQFDILMGV